jgi:hypothetical protein
LRKRPLHPARQVLSVAGDVQLDVADQIRARLAPVRPFVFTAYVSQGMKIGYVTDYFGKKVSEATSPIAGIVPYIGAVPSLEKGGTIAHIGEIEK